MNTQQHLSDIAKIFRQVELDREAAVTLYEHKRKHDVNGREWRKMEPDARLRSTKELLASLTKPNPDTGETVGYLPLPSGIGGMLDLPTIAVDDVEHPDWSTAEVVDGLGRLSCLGWIATTESITQWRALGKVQVYVVSKADVTPEMARGVLDAGREAQPFRVRLAYYADARKSGLNVDAASRAADATSRYPAFEVAYDRIMVQNPANADELLELVYRGDKLDHTYYVGANKGNLPYLTVRQLATDVDKYLNIKSKAFSGEPFPGTKKEAFEHIRALARANAEPKDDVRAQAKSALTKTVDARCKSAEQVQTANAVINNYGTHPVYRALVDAALAYVQRGDEIDLDAVLAAARAAEAEYLQAAEPEPEPEATPAKKATPAKSAKRRTSK